MWGGLCRQTLVLYTVLVFPSLSIPNPIGSDLTHRFLQTQLRGSAGVLMDELQLRRLVILKPIGIQAKMEEAVSETFNSPSPTLPPHP
jgi:hypothetical protein